MITLITGGARSGKSSYAAERALALSARPAHIATAQIWDEEFAKRVARHKADRGDQWEEYTFTHAIDGPSLADKIVVIDCVTLWLTNFFTTHVDTDALLHQFKSYFEDIQPYPAHLFVITNEIGMSLHAETAAGRAFTDLQGRVNQYLARVADEVVLCVAGIPVMIKTC